MLASAHLNGGDDPLEVLVLEFPWHGGFAHQHEFVPRTFVQKPESAGPYSSSVAARLRYSGSMPASRATSWSSASVIPDAEGAVGSSCCISVARFRS